MNVPKNLTSILSVLSLAFAVLGLAFSPAAAASFALPADGGQGTALHGFGSHGPVNATMVAGRVQAELTRLGGKGVDVSQAQAELNNGNVTAAVQWLREYLKANPPAGVTGTLPAAWNSTAMTERLQNDLSQLSAKGVDVSQAQADITDGNLTAATQWLRGYMKANPDNMIAGNRPAAWNSTAMTERLQNELSQLSAKGVDVSQAQSDITAGNLTAATQWLREYAKANPGALPMGTAPMGPRQEGWNSTAMTERLQNDLSQLSAKGVDVSQAQADITAGNLTAASQWLHQYLKANPGTLGNVTGSRVNGNTAWKGVPFEGHQSNAGSQTGNHTQWGSHHPRSTNKSA